MSEVKKHIFCFFQIKLSGKRFQYIYITDKALAKFDIFQKVDGKVAVSEGLLLKA